jgi:hypothetical protein
VGVAYNALPGQSLKGHFAGWVEDEYPEIWKQLGKKGRRKTIEGLDKFNIERKLRA